MHALISSLKISDRSYSSTIISEHNWILEQDCLADSDKALPPSGPLASMISAFQRKIVKTIFNFPILQHLGVQGRNSQGKRPFIKMMLGFSHGYNCYFQKIKMSLLSKRTGCTGSDGHLEDSAIGGNFISFYENCCSEAGGIIATKA